MEITTAKCLTSINNKEELCNVVYCEICGEPVLTPITEMPKHICKDCSKSLKDLIKENKND